MKTLEVFNQTTKTKIVKQAIYDGLKQVKKLTQLQGRWQTLSKNPLVICDTGHNEAGIKEVIKNIESTPHKNLHLVFGMVKDKDITKVLSLVPKNATYYFCKPDIERGLDAKELQEQARAFNLRGDYFNSVQEAKQAAINKADKDDLVFIGGSTFVVAEAI